MSGNTFISSRLELIENRFKEIDTLLDLAQKNITDPTTYSTLCRSAHVLLVSHVEGIYKDIVRDTIDDLNRNTDFITIKKSIFKTHSLHFIQNRENSNFSDNSKFTENEKFTEVIKDRLWEAFKNNKTELILEPFLRIDNKNPTPKILEEILKKFGENSFFNSLKDSRLEIVFENDSKSSIRELNRIKKYLNKGVQNFPYNVDKSYFYNNDTTKSKKDKGLFEEFLNEFLSDRHKIVHGQTLDNPKNDKEIEISKLKIEILIYAFIISICHCSNPIMHL
ncbi:RiboL-PSP-HEPN [Flavobacteriaceae bacterium]